MKVGKKGNNLTQLEEAEEEMGMQRVCAQSSKIQIRTVVKNRSFIMPHSQAQNRLSSVQFPAHLIHVSRKYKTNLKQTTKTYQQQKPIVSPDRLNSVPIYIKSLTKL